MRLRLALAIAIAFAAAPTAADMALNPDVRQDTITTTICTPGYTKSVRPSTSYTNGVKRKLLREAGLGEPTMSAYELDHIIPLALGGHPRSLDNLMLQPWEGEAGAKRKDRLEVKLQCLICSGQIALDVAQRAIYSDWQGAYQQYATAQCRRLGSRAASPAGVAAVAMEQQPEKNAPASEGFFCGTKLTCEQMSSCEEAKHYLVACGLTKLDRDGDGVPCESLCR